MYTLAILNNLRRKLISSRYPLLFINAIIEFFTSFSCRNPDPTYVNAVLVRKLCSYSNNNAIVPILRKTMNRTGSTWVNGHDIYREGFYGAMFEGQFNGERVLTKTLKLFTNQSIKEVYVNMVIINQILLRDPQYDTHDISHDCAKLVPTYGLFACKQNNYEQVCVYENRGPYYIDMVQKRLGGITFYDFLHLWRFKTPIFITL